MEWGRMTTILKAV
jgi:hypothetical protein